MRKQLRNIIISLCVVAALVIGIVSVNLFVKPKASADSSSIGSSSTASIQVFKTDSSKITSIHVKNSKGEYTIRGTSGKYTVDGVNVALNQSNLSSAVSAAASVEATKIIEKNASNLSQYGLQNPAATVDVTSGGTVKTIDIGNNTPLADGCYVSLKGSSEVFKAETTLATTFEGSAIDFVDTTISSIDQTKLSGVTSIVLGGASRADKIVISAQKQASASSASSSSAPNFVMTSPASYEIDSQKMTTLTGGIESLSATNAVSLDVSAASLEKYGLDKPQYSLTYTYNGKNTTIDFGTAYADGDTNYVPVMVEGKPVIYRIDSSKASFYNWQLSDICSANLYSDDISTVKSITVTSGSENYAISLSGTGDNMTATCGGKALTAQNLKNFYQVLTSMSFEGQLSSPAGGSAYVNVKIVYNDASKAPLNMNFNTIGSRQCTWSFNGRSDFYVLKDNVDKLLQVTRDFAAGKTVSAS